MPTDLTDLVRAAKAGDRPAFDELVRATYADAYTLAYRLTGNEEDARDVVQDAYLRAYKGLRKFRGDAQFTTWLYRITANCASTQLGKRTKHRHDELLDDAPLVDERPEVDPELRADASLDRHRVTEALQELPAQPAGGGRPARHLRPAPRGHRRGAGHHRGGRQGATAPGPEEAAGAPVANARERGRPVRPDLVSCDSVAELLPQVVEHGGAVDAPVIEHVEACLRCQAELVQYRRLLKALRQLRTEVLEPAPGTLTGILASLEAAGERGAIRSLLSGRRAAYVGGIAVATAAAGAAGALVLAHRARDRRVRPAA